MLFIIYYVIILILSVVRLSPIGWIILFVSSPAHEHILILFAYLILLMLYNLVYFLF